MIEDYDPLEGELLQILSPEGDVDGELEPDLDSDEVIEIYSNYRKRLVNSSSRKNPQSFTESGEEDGSILVPR